MTNIPNITLWPVLWSDSSGSTQNQPNQLGQFKNITLLTGSGALALLLVTPVYLLMKRTAIAAKSRIRELESQITEKDKSNSAKVEELVAKIGARDKAVGELEVDLTKSTEQVKKLSADVEELVAKISARDETIGELEVDLTKSKEQVNTLSEEIAKQEAEVADFPGSSSIRHSPVTPRRSNQHSYSNNSSAASSASNSPAFDPYNFLAARTLAETPPRSSMTAIPISNFKGD
jgi:uncharacterized coiled-coil protein SlyX